MLNKIIVDGALSSGSRLEVEVRGRGFAYGFGVFETIRFRQGQPCFFSQHFLRLAKAAKELGLAYAQTERRVREWAVELLAANEVVDGVFKIVVMDDGGRTRWTMFVRDEGERCAPRELHLELSPIVKASKAFTTRHKTLNYLETVRELSEARGRGVDELVFRNEYGDLTECSVSNLFFVQGGCLQTPALDCGLLDGIIRAQVLEVARERGLEAREGRFPVEALLDAEEVFVTNSGVGLAGVATFDAGDGRRQTFGSALVEPLRRAYLERELASAVD